MKRFIFWMSCEYATVANAYTIQTISNPQLNGCVKTFSLLYSTRISSLNYQMRRIILSLGCPKMSNCKPFCVPNALIYFYRTYIHSYLRSFLPTRLWARIISHVCPSWPFLIIKKILSSLAKHSARINVDVTSWTRIPFFCFVLL